jgi:C4-dicarboxylate-specific signal transduction histidine kinase
MNLVAGKRESVRRCGGEGATMLRLTQVLLNLVKNAINILSRAAKHET